MSLFTTQSGLNRRVGNRGLALALLLLAGGAGWSLRDRPTENSAARKSSRIQTSSTSMPGRPEPRPAPKSAEPVATPHSATPVQSVVQPSVQPGHEGHGDGCAQCLADRKLAACREDYARLHHGLIMGARDADDAQAQRLLEACRRLAAVVVTEWSFSESRPVLPSDEVVESRMREILEPMLVGIPTKNGGSR